MQMADNFINQPFGMNIKIPKKTLKQIEKTAQQHTGGIFDLCLFYCENQKVFTGRLLTKYKNTILCHTT